MQCDIERLLVYDLANRVVNGSLIQVGEPD